MQEDAQGTPRKVAQELPRRGSAYIHNSVMPTVARLMLMGALVAPYSEATSGRDVLGRQALVRGTVVVPGPAQPSPA